MQRFQVGSQYTRKDVLRILGIEPQTGGNWYTGYAMHNGEIFIFANVGTSGRTGHDYPNRFVGSDLEWYGKGNHSLTCKSIQAMLAPDSKVLIFTRSDSRNPRFTFQGYGRAKNVPEHTQPVRIVWELHESWLEPKSVV